MIDYADIRSNVDMQEKTLKKLYYITIVSVGVIDILWQASYIADCIYLHENPDLLERVWDVVCTWIEEHPEVFDPDPSCDSFELFKTYMYLIIDVVVFVFICFIVSYVFICFIVSYVIRAELLKYKP